VTLCYCKRHKKSSGQYLGLGLGPYIRASQGLVIALRFTHLDTSYSLNKSFDSRQLNLSPDSHYTLAMKCFCLSVIVY
jgi:hypothetical protein